MRRACAWWIATLVLPTVTVACQDSPSLGNVARQFRAEKRKPAESAPVAQSQEQKTPVAPIIKGDLNADEATDVQAFDKYESAIGELLRQEKFDELERTADSLLASKARFSGGVWKIRSFHAALSSPWTDYDKDAARIAHLERLKRWTLLKPNSISARVALAWGYISYGLMARGSGYANTVTEEGWKQYGERREMARATLQQASTLKAKSPEWFLAMLAVSESDNRPEELQSLLEQSIAFEPLYYSFYRNYAANLLPKWSGNEGDSEKFAEGISNRIGGTEGDIIYFEIAWELNHQSCLCDNNPGNPLARMYWPKVVKGYRAMEQKYGLSLTKLNQFTFMAARSGYADVAQEGFARIGDNWIKGIWEEKETFDQFKSWAALNLKGVEKRDAATVEAEGNLKTAEGLQFEEKVDGELSQQFAKEKKECQESSTSDLRKFDLLLQLDGNGNVHDGMFLPFTLFGQCLSVKLRTATFSAPPTPLYWVKIEMHPQP